MGQIDYHWRELQLSLQLLLNEPVSHAARPRRVVKLNPEFARRHHLGAVTRPQAEKRILNDARLAYDYRQRGRS